MQAKALNLFALLFLFCAFSLQLQAHPPEFPHKEPTIRLALYHSNPKLADLPENLKAMKKAMAQAKEAKADWFITSELSLTGYYFHRFMEIKEIDASLDEVLAQLKQAAIENELNLFLGHIYVDRKESKPKYFNTLFVITKKGKLIARHHKINTIPQSEDWSNRGTEPTVVRVDGVNVALQVCADAWPSSHTAIAMQKGAQLIINSANWAPGIYGPGDTWKKRSLQAEVPIIVVNRTGKEDTFDLTGAETVVAIAGEHKFQSSSTSSALYVIDLNLGQQTIQYLDTY